ncbi:MAG: uracil-DNA glycosylase [Spirochaetaceae bacterium]|nr:uracil-DNA glycosylase [Spirochaetaceae bacterium]
MTAAEKNQLYSNLRTISAWAQGYPSASFNGEIPAFTDDQELVLHQESVQEVSFQDTTDVSAPQIQGRQFQEASLEEISHRQEAIAKLEAQIKQCHRCKLCKGRTQAVPGTGVLNPAVLVIGEGPGADEDAQGLPFVGPAGQLLDKMLAAINLSRSTNCYIANIVKCRPPKNRDPEPEESDACRSYLEAQIAILKPTMILAVGRIAIQNLLQTSQGIGQLRGKILSYNNIPLMATYHPSALLRNQDLKRPAWEDLKIFRTHLTQLHPDYDRAFLQ